MNEILDIHNSNHLDVEMICNVLKTLGYNADYDARISRTLVWSDAPESISKMVIDLVFEKECI